MSIEATIWDFGGVLIRPKGAHPNEIIANKLGIPLEKIKPIVTGELNLRVDRGDISIDEYFQAVVTSLGLPREKATIFKTIFLDAQEINQQLVTYVRQLKKKSRTALLSNYNASLRHLLQTIWPIEDAFDEIVISGEVKLIKPDVRIYRLILSRLDLKPQETIFIDDKEEYIRGAAQLGIHTVLHKNTQQTINEVNALLKKS